MIKYGDDNYKNYDLRLSLIEIETRSPWIDIRLNLSLPEAERFPGDLVEPSAWVICDPFGSIVQMVVLDEGCDSEYQFTPSETEKITRFVEALQLPMEREEY